MGSWIIQMPGYKTPPLQHLNKFVEEDDTAIVRHPLVIPCDFYISRRSAHLHPYFTKSEVRVEAQKISQNPVNMAQNGAPYAFSRRIQVSSLHIVSASCWVIGAQLMTHRLAEFEKKQE